MTVRNPCTDAAHVHHELIALHWLSHAKGATAKEISDALAIRKVKLPAEVAWVHLFDLVDAGHAVDTGTQRLGRSVYKPTERDDL